MKSFLNKNKEIIIEFLIFSTLICLLIIIMNLKGYTLGTTGSDFINQHVRFIDYIRNNFWETKDFLPQMTMNFGGSQSMVSLYYYGMYNPLIMLSFLFPFINTLLWMQVMTIILTILTFLSMNLLLRRFDIKREYVILISVLTAFCPPLLYHFSYHIMFVYYFPIMIFSLYALDVLIKDKIKWMFIVSIALIFFTNFFFALIIGFMQLVFFIANMHFRYQFSKKEIINRYKVLFFSYLIGILIGMMVFLPQAITLFSGDRVSKGAIDMGFFFNDALYAYSFNQYSTGLGIIGIAVLIIGLLNYKNKFTFLIALAITVTVTVAPFIYLLNIFQYIHEKVFIYTIPLIFLMLALFINNKEIKYKKISVLFASIIVGIIFYLKFDEIELRKYLAVALIFQAIMLTLIFSENFKYKKAVITVVTLIFLSSSVYHSINLMEKKQFSKRVLLNKLKKDAAEDDKAFLRHNYPINFVPNMNTFTPLLYTSVINYEYLDFFNNFINTESFKFTRFTTPKSISNDLFSNFLGVSKYYNGKELVREYENARPFIYGVENKDIYNVEGLKDMSAVDKLLSLNSAFFSETAKTDFNLRKANIEEVYQSEANLRFDETERIFIKNPEYKRRDGIYIVKTNVISKDVTFSKITINNHPAYVRPINLYREAEERNLIFLLDSKEVSGNIEAVIGGSPNVYDKIKVTFIPRTELNEYNMDYIKTTDNNIELNKQYSFKLDMKNDGYLGTAIFYDKGFKIKDNGKEISKEKVNHNFLGAKLEKGKHNITIEYEISGFKTGIVLTLAGLFILAFIMIDEIKIFNKPFFRFVLVGGFNTVNYFIAYQLLLLVIPYMLAHGIGFIYSAFVSYFLTSFYTFKTKPTWKTFVAFPLTFLPNLILSSLGTMALVELRILDKSIASLVMMILIIPITFIINKLIFEKREK